MEKIYFDTEFTGLKKGTDLISIGLVDDYGDEFYAELSDFRVSTQDPDYNWLKANVLDKLKYYGRMTEPFADNIHISNSDDMIYKIKRVVYGNKDLVARELTKWLDSKVSSGDKLLMVSDCLAYDWVLFNDLFGHAFDIPRSVYYIPMDISTMMMMKGVDPDISREVYAGIDNDDDKHNALYDARVIKRCYEKLMLV